MQCETHALADRLQYDEKDSNSIGKIPDRSESDVSTAVPPLLPSSSYRSADGASFSPSYSSLSPIFSSSPSSHHYYHAGANRNIKGTTSSSSSSSSLYNLSVGGTPTNDLTDAFSAWGSTSGIVIGIMYVVSMCYVISDYLRGPSAVVPAFAPTSGAAAGAMMQAGISSSGAEASLPPTASLTLGQQLVLARKQATLSAELISTPDMFMVPSPSASTSLSSRAVGGYSVEDLKEAHGVKHIAVIMDGNRRFGKMKAAEEEQRRRAAQKKKKDEGGGENTADDGLPSATTIAPSRADSFITRSKVYRNAMAVLRSVGMGEKVIGHKAGGEKLLDFAKYCIRFDIPILTVYAFSTENWGRPQEEIDILMALFTYFFEQMREEAHKNGIYCRFIVGDASRLNPDIIALMREIEVDTRAIPHRKITVNVCVSYGSRLEIAQAAQSLAEDGEAITESSISGRLMRSLTEDEDDDDDTVSGRSFIRNNDPDILFRTSGESRLSNFLLYQCAYSEMIFTSKAWPSVEEEDLEAVLVEYCCRHRRFGK